MDLYFTQAWSWVQANPMTVFLALYIGVNIAKRVPPPKNPTLFAIWDLFERLMFLSWEALPGKLKLPIKSDPFQTFVEK